MLSQKVVIRSALYTGYYFNFTYKNGDLWSSGICYEASKSLWMNPHPFSLNSLPWSHFSTQTIFLTPHFRYFSKVSCSPDTSCLTAFTVHFLRVDLPCLDCHLRSSNLTFLLLIHQGLAQRPLSLSFLEDSLNQNGISLRSHSVCILGACIAP